MRKSEEKRILQGLIILIFFLTVLSHIIWSHVRFNFTYCPIESKTVSMLLWINFAIILNISPRFVCGKIALNATESGNTAG